MIRLAKPFIPDEAFQEIRAVLTSGQLIQGPQVQGFESLLAEYLGVSQAVLVSSGTAALHLSLAALGIHEGDEVIVPAFTFPATANVVELLGATPVLVDIALEDFCIDPKLIEEKIGQRTRAILPVHEFGQAADLARILEVSRRSQLPVVEDAACAIGAEYAGKKAGTWGEIGCFSFHPRKTITTGEGGAVVTENPEIAGRIRSLRNHGIRTIDGRLDFDNAGFNYRMTDLQAALGKSQMPYLHRMIEKRRGIAKAYEKGLAHLRWIETPRAMKDRLHSFQTYHVLVSEEVERFHLMEFLKRRQIETNIGAHALHCLSYFKERYGVPGIRFPECCGGLPERPRFADRKSCDGRRRDEDRPGAIRVSSIRHRLWRTDED